MLLLLVANGALGYRYFPQLDDWYQYGVGHLQSPLFYLLSNGFYTVRPVSDLVQAFWISRLWGHLGLVYLLLTVLAAASGLLAIDWFRSLGERPGPFFYVALLLNPIVFEGEYWIAAASQTVSGLFLVLLGNVLFLRLRSRRPYLAEGAYALLNLLGYGFYEQAISIGVLLGILSGVRAEGRFRLRTGLRVLLPTALMAAYYLVFYVQGHTGGASREHFVAGGVAGYLAYLPVILHAIANTWLGAPAVLFYRHGIPMGWTLLIHSPQALVLGLLFLLMATLTGLLVIRHETGSPAADLRDLGRSLGLGLLLFLCGYAPFFVLDYPWVAYRNAYIPGLGAALALDALLRAPGARYRMVAVLKGMLVLVLVFGLLLIRLTDLTDYRRTTRVDLRLAHALLRDLGPRHHALLLGAQWSYIPLDVGFRQHMMSAFSVTWAASPLLDTLTGRPRAYRVEPLVAGPAYTLPRGWRGYPAYGMTPSGGLVPLRPAAAAGNRFPYRTRAGVLFGTLIRMGGVIRYRPG